MFRLNPSEARMLAFVLLMIVLGVAVKHYRERAAIPGSGVVLPAAAAASEGKTASALNADTE